MSDWKPVNLDAIELPGFKLVSQLGQGGMATVYLAIQHSVEREVALKVMSPFLAADPNFSDRFLREAKIAAQLHHSHIVTVHDVGLFENYHFIAMQYLPGGKLSDVAFSDMTVKRAIKTVKEIASALDYAHGKGFVHRDVKPDNILFSEQGSAYLTDFGIARATNSNTQMTATGSIIGTPHYMSPEQARGRKVDHRADLYSLGIVFYELLTGEVPYQADETLTVCIMHVNDPIPRLPICYARLQTVLDQLLSKDPEDRFANGQAFIEAVEQIENSIEFGEINGLTPETLPHAKDETTRKNTPMVAHTPRPEAMAKTKNKSGLAKLMFLTLALAGMGYAGYAFYENWQDRKQQIVDAADLNQQLVKASALMESGQLIYPESNSALKVYHTLWQRHPEDERVIRGLEKLFESLMLKLESDVRSKMNPDDLHSQKETIQSILKMFPELTSNYEERLSNLVFDLSDPDEENELDLARDQFKKLLSKPDSDLAVLLDGWRNLIASGLERETDTFLELQNSLVNLVSQQFDQSITASNLAQGQTLVDLISEESSLQKLLPLDEWLLRLETLRGRSSMDEAKLGETQNSLDQSFSETQGINDRNDDVLANRIQQLLDEGLGFLQKDRLTRPKGESALDRFEQVLSLSDAHPDALAGIDKIIEKLNKLALNALSENKLSRAQSLRDSIESIRPEAAVLQALNNAIDLAQEKTDQVITPKTVSGTVKSDVAQKALILPDTIPALFEFAENAKQDKRIIEAVQAWRKVLSLDSENLNARMFLDRMAQSLSKEVSFLIDQGDLEKANAKMALTQQVVTDHTEVKAVQRRLNRANRDASQQQSVQLNPMAQLQAKIQVQRIQQQLTSLSTVKQAMDIREQILTYETQFQGVDSTILWQSLLDQSSGLVEALLNNNQLEQARQALDWMQLLPGQDETVPDLQIRLRNLQISQNDAIGADG